MINQMINYQASYGDKSLRKAKSQDGDGIFEPCYRQYVLIAAKKLKTENNKPHVTITLSMLLKVN